MKTERAATDRCSVAHALPGCPLVLKRQCRTANEAQAARRAKKSESAKFARHHDILGRSNAQARRRAGGRWQVQLTLGVTTCSSPCAFCSRSRYRDRSPVRAMHSQCWLALQCVPSKTGDAYALGALHRVAAACELRLCPSHAETCSDLKCTAVHGAVQGTSTENPRPQDGKLLSHRKVRGRVTAHPRPLLT